MNITSYWHFNDHWHIHNNCHHHKQTLNSLHIIHWFVIFKFITDPVLLSTYCCSEWTVVCFVHSQLAMWGNAKGKNFFTYTETFSPTANEVTFSTYWAGRPEQRCIFHQHFFCLLVQVLYPLTPVLVTPNLHYLLWVEIPFWKGICFKWQFSGLN